MMDLFDVLNAAKVVSNSVSISYISSLDTGRLSHIDVSDAWKKDRARVLTLLDEILCSDHVDRGLNVLLTSGVLTTIVPEVEALHGLGDFGGIHKDVWKHSLSVVAGVPREPTIRWSALMHDIGKATTRRVSGKKVTFHGHDVVGARMLDRMQERTSIFGSDPKRVPVIRSMILNHLRPASYKDGWTDSAVRRLVVECGGKDAFDLLMQLSKADLTTKNPKKRENAEKRRAALQARVERIMAQDSMPKLPKGTMGAIIEASGMKAGPWVNELRIELERRLSTGDIRPDLTIESYVAIASSMIQKRS